ncbi:MAG: cation:dicarboxylase symporter family transporter [Bacteroidia bacterium]|nr:cation:dicarboxylase symporter family transporter [Bacteroidia bacterium]
MVQFFRKNKLITLILIALILGIIVGYFINNHYSEIETSLLNEHTHSLMKAQIQKDFKLLKENTASHFSLLSEIFLRLIKMIIAPLVISILISGIGKIENIATLGRIGLKTLVYFYIMTFIALLLGLVSVNLFRPGEKMHLEVPEQQYLPVSSKGFDAHEFITHVIPDSIFNVLAKNEILPIVIFAVLFGIAAGNTSKGKVIFEFSEAVAESMFKLTHYIMFFAPVGVFGSIAAIVIKQGVSILQGYVYLIGVFYLTLLFFVLVVLGVTAYIYKINFLGLLRSLYEPVLLAFSTASSEAAMPATMNALKKFGISEKIVAFVLPLGYSFNLDGSITYMTFATVFIAQAYHIHLSIFDQINMMLILLLSSKGIAGVPRASLVIIAGMLSYFNIPVEGLLLLLAIDQILDMGRSATNVLGNAVASAVIAKSEKTL